MTYIPALFTIPPHVTHDLTNYSLAWLDLSRDASSLATIENNRTSDLWALPGGDSAKAYQITSGGSPITGASSFGKDHFAYQNEAGEVYSIASDGTNSTLIAGSDRNIGAAWSCGDGKHVVFQKLENDQTSLWRIDANGSNSIQLTSDRNVLVPTCSPDGQWITYLNYDPLGAFLVPINGGAPTKLDLPLGAPLGYSFISPDGKLLLFQWQDPNNLGTRIRLDITSVNGGPVLHSFERMIGGGAMAWAPDGRSVDYVVTRGGVSDIWRQPLSGGDPKQFTHFPSSLMYNFAWSDDGKTLLATRGNRTADIVLLKKPH